MRRKNTFCDQFVETKTIALAESGCMIWMGSTIKGGYGKTNSNGKTVVAHRAIWEARNGYVPDGMVLCHKCDVPSCVNPNHLFLGTHKDNSSDMVQKGRSAKGRKIWTSVLTEDLVRKMRSESGTYADIAAKYNIHPGTARQVMRRETWRQVL